MRDAIEMARESHLDVYGLGKSHAKFVEALERFAALVRKGMYRTIQFWREWGHLLWESGYEKALPQEAQDLFDNIDRVIEQAIKNYCKE